MVSAADRRAGRTVAVAVSSVRTVRGWGTGAILDFVYQS
jgi:hypothetical protein